jgi:hypothetical protein
LAKDSALRDKLFDEKDAANTANVSTNFAVDDGEQQKEMIASFIDSFECDEVRSNNS